MLKSRVSVTSKKPLRAAPNSYPEHWLDKTARRSSLRVVNGQSDFQAQRAARLARLRLSVADFEEKFARSSGPGGQHVNKVSTAVTLRHGPSGVQVTAQDSRSQAMNRQLAWTRILDAIEEQRRADRAEKRAAVEKKRRQNAPRPWGLKQKILENKRRRSEVKKSRRSAVGGE